MGPCDAPVLKTMCHGAESATKAVAGGIFDQVAEAFAKGLADVMKVLMTFWLKVPGPDLTSGNSAVTELAALTRPMIAFAAILGVIIAGGKMAITARSGESVTNVLRGLLLMIGVSAAGATLVATLLAAFDGFGTYVLNNGFDGKSVGTRLATLGALPGVGGGLLFLLALFGLIASLVQVAIMVVRGAILAVLVGVLPIAAASSITGTGYSWFKRLCGWVLSFTLYKLTASIIYAAAFTMIGTGQDLAGVVGGFALLAIAILALPALLRLLPPAMEAMSSGGGGAMAGVLAAGATGAAAFGGKIPRGGAPTHQPGLTGGPSSSGSSPTSAAGSGGDSSSASPSGSSSDGRTGSPGATGSPAHLQTAGGADAGGAGKSGAAGASGASSPGSGGPAQGAGVATGAGASGAGATGGASPAGAAVQAGAEAYQAAKSGAEGATGSGASGSSSQGGA